MTYDQIVKQMELEQQTAMKQADEERHAFRQRLTESMITKVTISFSGSGDSGQIDSVEFYYVEDHQLPESQEEVLKQDLTAWAYKYLEGVGVDWYNNDGGQGEIIFDLETVPFKFLATVEVNQTVSSVEHEVLEAL